MSLSSFTLEKEFGIIFCDKIHLKCLSSFPFSSIRNTGIHVVHCALESSTVSVFNIEAVEKTRK